MARWIILMKVKVFVPTLSLKVALWVFAGCNDRATTAYFPFTAEG